MIRPLLDCSRKEIVAYLKEKGASYRDDSTNKDIQLARNRIRIELVPYLESFNPRLMEALARQAFQSRETWAFIEAEARQALGRLCRRDDNGISIALQGLETLHPALQKHVLRQALKECLGSLRGVTSRHVDGILSLCGAGHSGGQIQISRRNVAVRQFDTLLLTKRPVERKPSFAYKLEIPGECRVAEAGVLFRSKICNTPDLKLILGKSATQAFLDPHTVPEFLTIRSKEAGDRYGGPRHRKVKKMLIDRKIPLLERSDLPMVAAGTDVIWVPGFRPARTYAVRPESPNCILVEIIHDAPVTGS